MTLLSCLRSTTFFVGVLAALAQAPPLSAQAAPERAKGTPELLRALAQGGYVVYFRHGHTHWQEKIIESAMQTEGRHDLANCATQRNLDEIGRDDAKRIHQALTAARIPAGKVLSSLYCRPAEYVALITGKTPVRTQWMSGLSSPETLKEIKREVATAPAPGTNTFLGGHGDRPFDLTGLIIQEGDALVFDPRNHRADDPAKFRPVAWIKPAEWAALAGISAALDTSAVTLGNVRVNATPQHDTSNLRAALPALAESQTLDRSALSRQLHLARDNPARNVEVQFTPATQPGRVDAELMAASVKPWSLLAGLTNTSVAGGRRERVLLGGEHVNLWNRDHQLALLASAEPGQNRADNASLAYRAPLPAVAGMLELKATHARDGGGTDADFAPITGAGRAKSVRYRQHLTPHGDYHHQASIAFEDREWSGPPVPLRSRPLSLGYSAHWEEEWMGWQFDARAVTNLSGGAGNDSASYALARPGARRDWSALRIDGEYLKVLTYDIRLIARARVQFSGDALIAGEQFALGTTLQPWGSAFGIWRRAPWLHPVGVRGLPERALAGDSGAQASIELWSRRLIGQDLRVGGFFDAGSVHRKNPLPGVTARANASSIGLGLHYQWRGNVALSMTAAHVLRGGGAVANHDGRVDVALILRY